MAKSWLANAKHVHDIGGMFYRPKPGESWDYELEARRESKVLELHAKRSERISSGYFYSHLHDSKIVDIKRVGDDLRITLNNINAADFAWHLARVLETSRPTTSWPIEITFSGVQYVRAAQETIDGGLAFLRIDQLREAEFLFDWTFDQDDRVQWIAEIWLSREQAKQGKEAAYLMVDSASGAAHDLSPPLFDSQFGDGAGALYLEAVRLMQDEGVNVNLYDHADHAGNFIREYLAANPLGSRYGSSV